MFNFFFSNSEGTGMGQVSSGRPWDLDWVMGAPRNPKYIKDRKIMGEKKTPGSTPEKTLLALKRNIDPLLMKKMTNWWL